MKMTRSLVLVSMAIVVSLMLVATVNGSTSVKQNFYACNQGEWNRAVNEGDVQINICTTSNGYSSGGQGTVQYQIRYDGASVASGGCNIGPCSNPTVVGINPGSYMIMQFYPSYVSSLQVIEPDNSGSIQTVWVPLGQYNYQNYLNCNPYFQFCYSQNQNYCSYSSSCSLVTFRIAATPITINVYFSTSGYGYYGY
jgi:hypothetical protein